MVIKISIPSPDLKFVQTTAGENCPKCNSRDYFNTGYSADNVLPPVDKAKDVPSHPVYRCNNCGQLFRKQRADEIIKKFPSDQIKK